MDRIPEHYRNKPIEEISDAFLEGEMELPVSKPSPKSYTKVSSEEISNGSILQRIRREIGATELSVIKKGYTLNITADGTDFYCIDLIDLTEWERGKMSMQELIKVGHR